MFAASGERAEKLATSAWRHRRVLRELRVVRGALGDHAVDEVRLGQPAASLEQSAYLELGISGMGDRLAPVLSGMFAGALLEPPAAPSPRRRQSASRRLASVIVAGGVRVGLLLDRFEREQDVGFVERLLGKRPAGGEMTRWPSTRTSQMAPSRWRATWSPSFADFLHPCQHRGRVAI